MDIKERAFKAVREHRPDGRNFKVLNVIPDFLDGTLVFVEFKDDDGDDDENYVYITSNNAQVMPFFDDVASLVAHHRPSSPMHRLVREVLQVGGIAGAIGVLITLTICYMFVAKGVTEIPPVLSGALTTILGFYFGSKTASK